MRHDVSGEPIRDLFRRRFRRRIERTVKIGDEFLILDEHLDVCLGQAQGGVPRANRAR